MSKRKKKEEELEEELGLEEILEEEDEEEEPDPIELFSKAKINKRTPISSELLGFYAVHKLIEQEKEKAQRELLEQIRQQLSSDKKTELREQMIVDIYNMFKSLNELIMNFIKQMIPLKISESEKTELEVK